MNAFISSGLVISSPSSPSSLSHSSPPTCTARSSRKPRKKPSSRPRRQASDNGRSRPIAIDDPLLNDNDIDTTDITTFVSCPICFNSLMIRPEQLDKAPLKVNCNCCGKTTVARIEKLEDLDDTFDYKRWRTEYYSQQMSSDEIAELQRFAADSSAPTSNLSSEQ